MQDPGNGLIQSLCGDPAGLDSFQDSGILDLVFTAAQQVISCQNRKDSGFSGTVQIRDGLHGQIIGDRDSVKSHLLPQVINYGWGLGCRECGIQSLNESMADQNSAAAGFCANGKRNEVR